MSKVVPSQVPPLIARCFGWAAQNNPEFRPQTLQTYSAMKVAAILAAVEAVPDHLVVLDPDDFAEFVTAKATLAHPLRAWERGAGTGYAGPNLGEDKGTFPHYGHPIVALRDTMAKCPDEAPTVATTGLTFIADPTLLTQLC